MTNRERIVKELDKLEDAELKALHGLVKDFVKAKKSSRRPQQDSSLMQSLRAIKIEGPADWSRNLDLYLSGEKRAEDDLSGHAVRRRPRKRA